MPKFRLTEFPYVSIVTERTALKIMAGTNNVWDRIFLLLVLVIALDQSHGLLGPKTLIDQVSPSERRIRTQRNGGRATKLLVSTSYFPLPVEDQAVTTSYGDDESEPVPESSDDTIDWTKYWYPIMPLNYLEDDEDLETRPVPMTILGRSLAIWRSSSIDDTSPTYSVVADVCPHRRAPLSTGKVRNNTLACRYHGWEFDSDGTCTKIPMMAKSDGCPTANKALSVQSYPTLKHEGLLWVYMDPTEENPPPLPAASTSREESIDTDNMQWSLNVFPVSMQSAIENSYDPSHAPFTHEMMDASKPPPFGGYSPDNVIPMEQYEIIGEMSKSGFTVRHTPYHVSPMAPPGADKAITTRQFVAPFTTIANLPMFNTTIHFVPSRPGETLVFGGGTMFFSGKKKENPLIPKRLRPILRDFAHLWFSTLGAGPYRFYNQDVQIMQGQDERKRADMVKKSKGRWNDLYPTKSDFGVQTFQHWMTHYNAKGKRPEATMPSKDKPLPLLSAWDKHAKYCPQCKRSLKLLATVLKRSNQVSKWSLCGATALTMTGAIASVIVKARSPLVILLFTTLLSLAVSMMSRLVGRTCSSTLERVFASPTQVPELQMMDIYSR